MEPSDSDPRWDWPSVFSNLLLSCICVCLFTDCACCTDDYKPELAQEVINSTHLLHFTFLDVPDPGKSNDIKGHGYPFPTVLYLIGKMFSIEGGKMAVYAHGHVLRHVQDRLDDAGGAGVPVSITASKIHSYYLGFTPSMTSLILRAAVLNGTVTEVKDHTEKEQALQNIVNGVVPGRWDNTRPVNDRERNMVHVLRVDIDKDKSHTHTHMERHGTEWYDDVHNPKVTQKYWEGSIPIWEAYGEPINGPNNKMKNVPPYVTGFIDDMNKKNYNYSKCEAGKKWPYDPFPSDDK